MIPPLTTATSKKIDEFLPFYYGADCDFAVIVPGQELNFTTCKIDTRVLHNVFHSIGVCFPHLRPIKSMLPEEMIKFARRVTYTGQFRETIITPKRTGNTVGARLHNNNFAEDEYCSLHYDKHTFESIQDLNHCYPSIEVSWYSEHRRLKTKYIHTGSPSVWLYLMKQSFDIFYLIEESLARDKTKIKSLEHANAQ